MWIRELVEYLEMSSMKQYNQQKPLIVQARTWVQMKKGVNRQYNYPLFPVQGDEEIESSHYSIPGT